MLQDSFDNTSLYFLSHKYSSRRPTSLTILASSARDILPSSIETSPSIGQQTFFLGFFSILVELSLVQSRRAEERGNKNDQVDPYSEDNGQSTNYFLGLTES